MKQSYISRAFDYCLKRIPLVGRLGEVTWSDKKQAFFETLATFVFSTMPFWVLPALGYFIWERKPGIDEALRNGEGLIYAAATLGPLVYAITKRYGNLSIIREGSEGAKKLSVSFPYGGLFIMITALSCAVAGFAFASTQRSAIGVDRDGVYVLSVAMMVGSTIIFFLVTAYKNMLDGIDKNKTEKIVEEQPRQEDKFLNDWLGSKS